MHKVIYRGYTGILLALDRNAEALGNAFVYNDGKAFTLQVASCARLLK